VILTNLNLLLLLNSIIIVILILNQNDNIKDSFINQRVNTNPLEKITWISLFLELSFLLIKIKNPDF
jgi:hypothetical protein